MTSTTHVSQTSLARTAHRNMPGLPVHAPTPQRPTLCCPTGSPLDAWLRLEDICWRLRQEGLRVSYVGRTLRIQGLREAALPLHLRSALLDPTTYAWEVDGAHGAVIATLDYDGLDLVITLPCEAAVRRAREAEAVLQLRAAFAIALVRRGLVQRRGARGPVRFGRWNCCRNFSRF